METVWREGKMSGDCIEGWKMSGDCIEGWKMSGDCTEGGVDDWRL